MTCSDCERLKKKQSSANLAIISFQSEIERLKVELARLNEQATEYAVVRDNKIHEVVRLKKELEDRKFNLNNAIGAGLFDEERQAGIVEGERRAMERVKVFVTQARHNSVELFGRAKPEWCEGVEDTLKELERIFGLGGEEEKR